MYVGKVAVWRYPCHSVQDIELQEAIMPPNLRLLPSNCLVLSRHGRVNSRMAGGDLDGDLNMVTFSSDIIGFLEDTESSVREIDLDALEASVRQALLPRPDKLWFVGNSPSERRTEYKAYAQRVPTRNFRGQVCSTAERATMRAFFAAAHEREHVLHQSLMLAVVGHIVLDAPKKVTGVEVINLADSVLSVIPCVHRESQRCSDFTKEELQLELPVHPKNRAFMLAEGWLAASTCHVPKGQLWLPLDTIVLGEAAGNAVMECILKLPKNEKHFRRSGDTSILQQIAMFFYHKLHRKLGSDVKLWHKLSAARIEAALKETHRTPILTWRALMDSKLA